MKNTITTITTAARRMTRAVNATIPYFDCYFDANGYEVDSIEHGCWRDNTPSNPFPTTGAKYRIRGRKGYVKGDYWGGPMTYSEGQAMIDHTSCVFEKSGQKIAVDKRIKVLGEHSLKARLLWQNYLV